MHTLVLPRLGQTMEKGTVQEWLKQPGEEVAVGEGLYEVETEKSTVEVEAKQAGTLARIVAEEGSELRVGALLAIVADPGEVLSEAEVDAAVAAAGGGGAAGGGDAGGGGDAAGGDAAAVGGGDAAGGAPAATSNGGAPEADAAVAAGAGGAGASAAAGGGRVAAAPAARALAKQAGIDLATVQGTGRDGSVTKSDVEAAVAGGGSATASSSTAGPASPAASAGGTGSSPGGAAAAPAEPEQGGPAVRERRRVQGVGRAMAEAVTASWTQIPQFVQTVLVDVTELKRRRQEATRADGSRPGYTDLLVAAVAQVAQAVPEANASWRGEEIVLYEDVNVSVAVMAEGGLFVPVIQRAQALDVDVIGSRLGELAQRARAGRLQPQDMEGGTITVSNLGMGGVEFGTPIVTPPQSAIVFAGAIVDRAVAIDGALELRATMYLSVAYDHRVLSGAVAAGFTGGLKKELEAA